MYYDSRNMFCRLGYYSLYGILLWLAESIYYDKGQILTLVGIITTVVIIP